MTDPFLSSDASSVEFRVDLKEAVRGDRRKQLEAIRDYLAHELESNRCNACLNSKLRTGDQAALILRLTTILKEIEELPVGQEGMSTYDQLRARRDARTNGASGTPDSAQSRQLGTKHGERRQGGRRPRGVGGAEA